MFQAHVLIIRRSKLYYTASGNMTLKQASGYTEIHGQQNIKIKL